MQKIVHVFGQILSEVCDVYEARVINLGIQIEIFNVKCLEAVEEQNRR